MGMLTGAVVGSAVLGAGASMMAADAQADAASDASDAQVRAARESNELQKWIYEDTKAMNQPWVDTGLKALGGLEKMAGTTGAAAAPKLQQRNPRSEMSDSDFIRDIYKQGLAMENPEQSGVDYWARKVGSGADRAEIAQQMGQRHALSGGVNNVNALNFPTKEETEGLVLRERQNQLMYGGKR